MCHKLIATILCLSIFPVCSFAQDKVFQPGFEVLNNSSQTVLITHDSPWGIKNYSLPPDREVDSSVYGASEFTITPGEAFSHTVTITSAADNKVICAVKSDLKFNPAFTEIKDVINSNPSKCEANTFKGFNRHEGPVYGIFIIVKD